MEQIDYEGFKPKFLEYLKDENYVAAYSNLKESGLNKMDRNELAGLLVKNIIDDLENLSGKGHSEKRAMLHSLLLWIFRDYPGLSNMYKGQLRQHRDDRANILSFLNDMRNPDSAKERVSEEMDKVIDGVKQNLQDTAEDIKTGRAQDKVKDFIDQAEANVKEGIKNLADIFDTVKNKNNDKDKN